jgi:hypothetical protein
MNVLTTVQNLADARLQQIGRRIKAGHDRADKGGKEWIEGSIEVAVALREGRETMPANISFKDWLAKSQLSFYSHHDRAALINLAGNPELMRTILSETPSKSYERIWSENKGRFTSPRKTTKPTRTRNTTGRRNLFREMKLGEETVARIRGTSLDSAAELDELVMLNRGAAPGELTDIVKQLVDDAAAGKDVSAIAQGERMNRRSTKVSDLRGAWSKRMVATWKMSNQPTRLELVKHQIADLDAEHRRKLADYLTTTEERPS